MTQIPLLGIDHVVIRVQKLPQMLAFYTEVLSCEVAKHNRPLDLWHLHAGSPLVDLVSIDGVLVQSGGASGDPAPPAELGRHVDHVAFKVHSFDASALLAHLQAHGIDAKATLQTRIGAEGDGRSIQSCDPEGNSIELKGF